MEKKQNTAPNSSHKDETVENKDSATQDDIDTKYLKGWRLHFLTIGCDIVGVFGRHSTKIVVGSA